MGWRGNLRTGIAIVRRIERAEMRRASDATKQYKLMLKQEAFEDGQRAVQEYNDYIELISSTHKEANEKINWHDILGEARPTKPSLFETKQKEAEFNLANFKPSVFDNLLGSTKKKLQKLESLIVSAKEADKKAYENELEQYIKDRNEWAQSQDFAKGIIANDAEAYKKVIEHLDPFSDIKEIGSGLNIQFGKKFLSVTLLANGVTVIPDFILTQTSTGKVSKKKMPVGKFYELYQDYVCSCVLRVAREIFSFLPVNYVFINAKSEMLNSINGHLEKQTILSVAIPAQTLDRLNFESIDPSDSMRNFVHNMKFSKTTGFSAVNAISPNDIRI